MQAPDTRVLPLARALSAEPSIDEFKPGVFSFLTCSAPPKVCGDDKPPSPPARVRAEPTAPLLNLGAPLSCVPAIQSKALVIVALLNYAAVTQTHEVYARRLVICAFNYALRERSLTEVQRQRSVDDASVA